MEFNDQIKQEILSLKNCRAFFLMYSSFGSAFFLSVINFEKGDTRVIRFRGTSFIQGVPQWYPFNPSFTLTKDGLKIEDTNGNFYVLCEDCQIMPEDYEIQIDIKKKTDLSAQD